MRRSAFGTEVCFAETKYPRTAGWHSLSVLAGERWKLVLSLSAELYNINADPTEASDLSGAHSTIVQGWRRAAPSWKRPPAPSSAQVDADAAERLRALGYVSGTAWSFWKG